MDSWRRTQVATGLRTAAHAYGWLPWRLVREIHERAETPTLLMAWRLAGGYTQEDVARGIQDLAAADGAPCAPSPNVPQISRWENGKDRPGVFYRRYFALWYRTTPDRLGLGEPQPMATLEGEPREPGIEEDDVDRRQFLGLAAAMPALGGLNSIRERMDANLRHVLPESDLAYWWDTTNSYVTTYGYHPPELMLDRLALDLEDVAELAERYPRQRDLHLIASRMCGLVGALHTDLDNGREARAWLHTAARYADVAGDPAQQGWVAMAQAMSAYYGPSPVPVIRIAERTRRQLSGSPTAPAAQLAGLAARTHARLGNIPAARRELERAHGIFAKLEASQIDAPFFGFPSRELLMYTSQVLSRIDDPRAWDAQATALAAYPEDDPMDRPLIALDRAGYLARRGEPQEAAATATGAIRDLAPNLRVPLLMGQARGVGGEIQRVSPAAARDYHEQLAAIAN